MIEVEIKVLLTGLQKAELIKGAQFIAQEELLDEYYDSYDFSLTTNGYWLRRRNGKFELKLPATSSGNFDINKNIPMYEIYDINIIAQTLGLAISATGLIGVEEFEFALEKTGYMVLYKFVNTRKSYAKNGFKIDFDIADFGDLIYEICEVETEVDFKEQADTALDKLYSFVREYGIYTDKAESKIGHYIRLKNPTHYSAIINSSKNRSDV